MQCIQNKKYKVSYKSISGEKNRVSVRKKTPIYREFNVFIRDNEKETGPFEMITSGSTSSNALNRTITATIQENVLFNKQEMLGELRRD